jgi:hypothetical protein
MPHLRGAPTNSHDPSADEGKKLVRPPTCFAETDRKCLVPPEGAPALGGGRITPSRHVTGHCGLRDIESKFQ